jgi:V8-like Glu-specific endopeptidase
MPLRPLTFLGDRDAPDPLSDVHARQPIVGSGRIPKELQQLKDRRTVYVSGSGNKKPTVSVARADGGRGVWRVDIPADDMNGHRPGESMVREEPASILKAVAAGVDHTGHRPEWADAMFVPRAAVPDEPQTMRRFDGRRVRPLWVFGADDRWQFRDPSWPWGLVGRVFNSRGYSGTGTLVGNRLVVTAGHMVPWGDNPWWMLFVPAYYDGSSLHGAGVQSYVSDARGYDVHGNVTGYDWAVLRLYEPLGSSLGYFGFNGYSDSWNNQPYWSIIGYPGAIANAMRPSFQGSITVDDVDGDSNGGAELESETADLTPGNSGGPMFGWWGGDPRIVGVVSGEEEIDFLWWTIEKDNVMAGGSGYTSIVAWGRSNWPA